MKNSALRIVATLASAVTLSGCSRPHVAETPTELRDELRIIGAAARAEIGIRTESNGLCLDRRLLATCTRSSIELDASDCRPGRSRLSPARVMNDDQAIREALGNVRIGAYCESTRSFAFTRVHFLGNEAIVSAQHRGPCGSNWRDFRLRLSQGEWRVEESRLTAGSGSTFCPSRIPARRFEGHLTVVGERPLHWLPPSRSSPGETGSP